MSSYILPANLKKTIRFPRLSSKSVIGYEVYTKTLDETYESGIRNDLLDTIINPSIPTPIKEKITLEYTNNATWHLPKHIYLDKDHSIIILIDGIQISSLCYNINKLRNIFSISTNKVSLAPDTKIEMIYYKDIIEKSYLLKNDCEIFVKPVIKESYQYGDHNIIL